MTKGMKTGGRQKGTPNKATVERNLRAAKGLEAATLDGLLPLDVMLYRMRNEALPNGSMVTDDQMAAAIAAAPYIHPKLAAAMLKSEVEEEPVKLELDYSLLDVREMEQLLGLIEKATPRPAEENEPLKIKREVEDSASALVRPLVAD